MHIRGIKKEDYQLFKQGKMSFQSIILHRSLHVDLRLKLEGLERLVQFVIVESDIESYIRMMKGEKNPDQKGANNTQKSKVVWKPSGEPSRKRLESI
jgi:hypothetical protein